jgi:hypothetical protein
MKLLKWLIILILIFLIMMPEITAAQEIGNNYLKVDCDTAKTDIKFYGGLTHQHQNFYSKAFSFTGLEADVIINKEIILGIYGSTFISNLEVNLAEKTMYLSLAQCGLAADYIRNDLKFISTGLLLNIGYISIIGNNSSFALFKPKNPSVEMNGVVIAPQIFAGIDITEWLNLRIGLAYNFYLIKDQPMVSKKDLQNLSINFGFFFGNNN